MTQVVPAPSILLASLPSGREIHSVKPYTPPELSMQSLESMRAPPDRSEDFTEGGLSSDEEEKGAKTVPVGAFPGTQEQYRSESARSYY
jgi:hypothetical protein